MVPGVPGKLPGQVPGNKLPHNGSPNYLGI